MRTIFKKMAKNRNEETGVILKIQRRTGCLFLIIGAAMLAFVLTDLFKSGPSAFSNTQNSVGEIAGEKIDYARFQGEIDKRRNLYATNDPTRVPDDATLREEAWNSMINDLIVKKEHDALGLKVSADEFSDVTVGNMPHPRIVQSFTNQETGQFDKPRFIQFLESDIQDDEDLKNRWLLFFEEPIKDELIGAKYDKYIKSGLYVTKLDVQQGLDEMEEISAEFVGATYSSIADSTINVTDNSLSKFLSSHSDDYQQESSKSIKFVVVNVLPSSEDSARVKDWADGYVDRFKNSKDDSIFVKVHRSETPFNPQFMSRGNFDPSIEDQLFDSDSGAVIGPVYGEGVYSLYRISGISQDSIASKRARHILIPVLGSELADTTEALSKAKTLLSEIRSGEKTFEDESKGNLDGSGSREGDLGWIREEGFSRVASDLRDEIFNRSKGSIFVKKAEDGIHIVEVMSDKSSKTVQVAVLNRTITPGNKTDREAERLAAEIQYQCEQGTAFDEAVEAKKLTVREANAISEESKVVPGIQSPITLIRWLYESSTKVGSTSDVLDLNDRYVVAQCTEVREEGTMTLEQVRGYVEIDYLKSEKAKILAKQMKDALAGGSDFQKVAESLSSVVRTIPVQSFNQSSVSGIGVDPVVLGTLFGLNEGETSDIVEGENGVYVMKVTGKIDSDLPSSQEEMATRLTSDLSSQADGKVFEALQKSGDIVDSRYKFFQ